MRVVKSQDSGRWMFDAGKHLMSASCHHQRNGACGGCYARAVETISAIAAAGNEVAQALLLALKSEVAPPSSTV